MYISLLDIFKCPCLIIYYTHTTQLYVSIFIQVKPVCQFTPTPPDTAGSKLSLATSPAGKSPLSLTSGVANPMVPSNLGADLRHRIYEKLKAYSLILCEYRKFKLNNLLASD